MNSVLGSSIQVVLISSSPVWSPVYLTIPAKEQSPDVTQPALTLSQAALVGGAAVVTKNPKITRRFWGGHK